MIWHRASLVMVVYSFLICLVLFIMEDFGTFKNWHFWHVSLFSTRRFLNVFCAFTSTAFSAPKSPFFNSLNVLYQPKCSTWHLSIATATNRTCTNARATCNSAPSTSGETFARVLFRVVLSACSGWFFGVVPHRPPSTANCCCIEARTTTKIRCA